MPIGSNLRIFKSHIQPVWEDDLNCDGGNWIVVPRPRELAGVIIFKELLLSIIGGELDKLVNGIVLSVKSRDIITQIWLPTTKQRKREKVHAKATEALATHCRQLLNPESPSKVRVEWTWRAHPTTTHKNDLVSIRGERATSSGGDTQSTDPTRNDRGSCGECVGNAKASCAIQ